MFLAAYYSWIKAVHVIAVISWMAGMLYLPRLYVYHAQVKMQSEAINDYCIYHGADE